MTDAEAEAVLRALGGWKWHEGEEPDHFFGRQGETGRLYMVARPTPSGRWEADALYLAGETIPAGENVGTDFATSEEAKAACERHHATGKWE